jgi:PIN domain nuclease of toxin-antitoxin system
MIQVALKEAQAKLPDLLVSVSEGNAITMLEMTPKHLDILKSLPFHHKDPFDRLIISQSIRMKALW